MSLQVSTKARNSITQFLNHLVHLNKVISLKFWLRCIIILIVPSHPPEKPEFEEQIVEPIAKSVPPSSKLT